MWKVFFCGSIVFFGKIPGWWIGCMSELKGVGLDYLTIKTSVNKALGTYDF